MRPTGQTSVIPRPTSPPSEPPATLSQRREILATFQQFESNFRRNYPVLWWGTLVGPFAVTFAAIVLLYFQTSPAVFRSLMGAAAVSFFAAGRFVILMEGLGDWAQHLTPMALFWMVTWQDVAVALFMAFHVGFLFRLPWIGPKIADLTVDGEMILALNPWMRNVTFVGLIAFIAFPLAATGSVGGAIFGRLLGLSRWATFWGSVIGAVLGNYAMLVLAAFFKRYLPQDSPLIQYGGLVTIICIIIVLERRYRSLRQDYVTTQNVTAETDSTEPQK